MGGAKYAARSPHGRRAPPSQSPGRDTHGPRYPPLRWRQHAAPTWSIERASHRALLVAHRAQRSQTTTRCYGCDQLTVEARSAKRVRVATMRTAVIKSAYGVGIPRRTPAGLCSSVSAPSGSTTLPGTNVGTGCVFVGSRPRVRVRSTVPRLKGAHVDRRT